MNSLNSFSIGQTFRFRQINTTDISKVIDKLKSKSSTGIDNLSTILLKKVKSCLLGPLTLIVNQSLTTGIFPEVLKR